MNCNKFILFISNSYLKSHNCKREFNFAISRQKSILSIYLEEVSLTPGMEMQLGTYQAVFRKRYANDEVFCASLCEEPFFDNCRFASDEAEQVQNTVPHTYQAVNQEMVNTSSGSKEETQTKPKTKKAAVLFSFFLGWCGVNFFYMRRPLYGALCILLLFVDVLFAIAAGVIMGIVMLFVKEETFLQKFVKNKKAKPRKG